MHRSSSALASVGVSRDHPLGALPAPPECSAPPPRALRRRRASSSSRSVCARRICTRRPVGEPGLARAPHPCLSSSASPPSQCQRASEPGRAARWRRADVWPPAEVGRAHSRTGTLGKLGIFDFVCVWPVSGHTPYFFGPWRTPLTSHHGIVMRAQRSLRADAPRFSPVAATCKSVPCNRVRPCNPRSPFINHVDLEAMLRVHGSHVCTVSKPRPSWRRPAAAWPSLAADCWLGQACVAEARSALLSRCAAGVDLVQPR